MASPKLASPLIWTLNRESQVDLRVLLHRSSVYGLYRPLGYPPREFMQKLSAREIQVF